MSAEAAQQAPATKTTSTSSSSGGSSSMQKYLDRAKGVLEKFGVLSEETHSELLRLLEEVRHVDESKVLAIAGVVKHMSEFNTLVRENVENINVGNRYLNISQSFDSIREDSKRLIAQLDDGKIGFSEKMSNVWMKLRRGTPHDRFEEIVETYKEVCKDTKDQLEREQVIMDGYIDFRFALKEA
ncbi:MAG: cell surface protein, partial [Planctomycetota bacterium]